MNEQIGRVVSVYGADYKIVSAHPFNSSLVNMIRIAEQTGKYPATFWFAKILKNGEVSKKQGFAAFVFKSGSFTKL